MFPGPPRGYVHYLCGRFPGRAGYLFLPLKHFGYTTPPYYMPYAADNGAYTKWSEKHFMEMLILFRKFAKSPLWVVVPDVVGNAEQTMRMWHEWKDRVSSFGYPLAFACQDGMEPQDVPKEAFCAFIGGTTEWKLANAERFKRVCNWLHIGRVSTGARLKWAERIGADSCDGTGWFREGMNGNRVNALIEYFEGSPQGELFNGNNLPTKPQNEKSSE